MIKMKVKVLIFSSLDFTVSTFSSKYSTEGAGAKSRKKIYSWF